MGRTTLSNEFLKMKIGAPIRYVPDAPIYCPHCAAHGRRNVIIKRDMPYQAKYLGRQDVDGTTCDVLYIHSGPMCNECGYEIYSVYFPTRGGQPVLSTEPDAEPEQAGGGDGLRGWLITLALVGVFVLAVLTQWKP